MAPEETNSNGTNWPDRTLENCIKVLNYHQHSMESRRGLELKMLTGIVGFYLLALKGTINIAKNVYDVNRIYTLVQIVFLCGVLFYVIFVFNIERASGKNRRWQEAIIKYLPEALNGKIIEFPQKPNGESCWKKFTSSWAGVWCCFVVVVIALTCFFILQILKCC